MRTLTILKGVAALALLTSFGAANAAHFPSPCTGNAYDPAGGDNTTAFATGSNCMYLTMEGNTYDSNTGNRFATSTSLTLEISVWIDFNTVNVTGGGFDILFDTTNVTSMSWTWNLDNGEQTTKKNIFADTANENIGLQFDDTSFDGYYLDGFAGSGCAVPGGQASDGNPANCHNDGFQSIGTLSVTLSQAQLVAFSIAQPYGSADFPNCFAGGPNSGTGPNECVATDFYSLTVDAAAVPLPAAVWMMLAGIGSLGSFARRRS